MSGAVSPNSLAALMSDELVQKMLGEIDVGVLRLDLAGQVLYRNDYAADLIGADTQLLDRSRWLATIHPDDYLPIRQVFEQALSGAKLPILHPSRSRRPNGEAAEVYEILDQPSKVLAMRARCARTGVDRNRADARSGTCGRVVATDRGVRRAAAG